VQPIQTDVLGVQGEVMMITRLTIPHRAGPKMGSTYDLAAPIVCATNAWRLPRKAGALAGVILPWEENERRSTLYRGPPLPAQGRQPAQRRVRLAVGPERHHVGLRLVPQLR
jgi:hypothetical protein